MKSPCESRTSLHCIQRQRRLWRNRRRCHLYAYTGVETRKLEFTHDDNRYRGEKLKRTGFNVVVTGSTKGLGKELARQFVLAGDNVCISSRNEVRVRECVDDFGELYGNDSITGIPCDVADPRNVEDLVAHAASTFNDGGVDIWICNAGTNAYIYENLEDFPPEKLEWIVNTNTLGTLLSCRAAIKHMKETNKSGHIFLVEGAGTNGSPTSKFAAYGMTKAGIKQLAATLNKELQGTPLKVHTLSPGIVYTEMVDAGKNSFGKVGRIFVNALAEKPEIIAEYLTPKIRDIAANTNGFPQPKIEYLSPLTAIEKLLNRFVLGKNKVRPRAKIDLRFSPLNSNTLLNHCFVLQIYTYRIASTWNELDYKQSTIDCKIAIERSH